MSTITCHAGVIDGTGECNLNNGILAKITSTQDSDGNTRFKLAIDNAVINMFPDGPTHGFPAPPDIVLNKCIDGALVYVINYGPPYQVGFLVTGSHNTKGTQTIYFSEKELPTLLYRGKNDIKLIIPNSGNEVPNKFIVYHSNIISGQDEQSGGSDALPDQKSYTITKITP